MRFKNIARRIAVSALAATLGLGIGSVASAQTFRGSNANSRLQNENERLRNTVDSLNRVIDSYMRRAHESEQALAKLEEESRKNAERKSDAVAFNLGAEARDSISLWDAQERIARISEESFNMDSVKLDSKVSDDIYLERIKNMNNIFTLPYNDIVRNYVVLYAEKRRSSMPTTLGLCSYWFPVFQETFNRYGIPEELACMAIIESGMNPLALSKAGARGMWQFMYATAKVYGLRIDSYVDERLDVYKAADAAARYLLAAYNQFGDWSLAISSYNCGSGNVKRAIARNGGNTDYWGIYQYLPKETRGYVPAFVGALYITKYYREHGMDPKPCALPVKVDTFMIHKKLHFAQVQELVGVPIAELRNLNPQYVHDIVPGNDREYVLRIPEQYVERFIAMEDSVYRHKADSLFNPVVIKQIENSSAAYSGQGKITYKVKSGDTLSKIASKYHVSVNDIKRWNNLKSTNIRVGQNLYIYKGGQTKQAATVSSSSAPSSADGATAVQDTDASAENAKDASADEQAKDAVSDEQAKDETEDEEIREITQHPQLEREAATDSATEAQSKPEPDYIEYTVKKGDTMYGISKQFDGISAKEIMEFNGIDTNIHPGDVIRIPVKR